MLKYYFQSLSQTSMGHCFQSLSAEPSGTDEVRDINYWKGGIWRCFGLDKVKIQVERNVQMMGKYDGHWMWNYITRRAALPSTVPFAAWQNQLFYLSHPKKPQRSNDFSQRLFNSPLSDEWTSPGHTHSPAAFTAVWTYLSDFSWVLLKVPVI